MDGNNILSTIQAIFWVSKKGKCPVVDVIVGVGVWLSLFIISSSSLLEWGSKFVIIPSLLLLLLLLLLYEDEDCDEEVEEEEEEAEVDDNDLDLDNLEDDDDNDDGDSAATWCCCTTTGSKGAGVDKRSSITTFSYNRYRANSYSML